MIELKVEYNFDDLLNNCWSGAIDTLQTIQEKDKEDEFMNLIIEMGFDTLTSLNDYLWFEDENIFELLGIKEEEKTEEEEI